MRKYSTDGKLVGAYLSRSLFPPGLPPGLDGWQTRRITVTHDRVGVEAVSGNVSNQREWVELDLQGNLMGRWRWDPFDQFPGVALTSDNQASRGSESHMVIRDRQRFTYVLMNIFGILTWFSMRPRFLSTRLYLITLVFTIVMINGLILLDVFIRRFLARHHRDNRGKPRPFS